jgi:hypothetical protein
MPDRGNLPAVRAGSSPRVVARGCKFNQLGVSRCGSPHVHAASILEGMIEGLSA